MLISWSKSESNQWEKYFLCLRRESIPCCDPLAFFLDFPQMSFKSSPLFNFIHLPAASPGHRIFSCLKGCSCSWLGRRLRKPARRKQQEFGQQQPQKSNVWSLVMVLEKLLLLKWAWLGLPWGTESMFEHLGRATRPHWVAPRNTNLSLRSTWYMGQELASVCHGPCTHLGPLQHPTRAGCSLWVCQNWHEMSNHLSPVALQCRLLLNCSIWWLQGKWESRLQPCDVSVSVCGWSPGEKDTCILAYPTTCLHQLSTRLLVFTSLCVCSTVHTVDSLGVMRKWRAKSSYGDGWRGPKHRSSWNGPFL